MAWSPPGVTGGGTERKAGVERRVSCCMGTPGAQGAVWLQTVEPLDRGPPASIDLGTLSRLCP